MAKTRRRGMPLDGPSTPRRSWGVWGKVWIGIWLVALGLGLAVGRSLGLQALVVKAAADAVPGGPGYGPALIEPARLWAEMQRPDGPMVLDVRSPFVFELGHLPWAINVPSGEVLPFIDRVPLGVKLALYCS